MLPYLTFLVAACVSVFSAVKLSTYADVISKQTKMTGFVVGTMLLAVATSLPELTTTVSAAAIGNADIAVGNGLGSIIFNLFVIFAMDLLFYKKRIFLRGTENQIYPGILSVLLISLVFISLWINLNIEFLGIGVTSIIIVICYIGGMRLISQKQKVDNAPEKPQSLNNSGPWSLRRVVIRFCLFSLLILFSGSLLSISGDTIASTTGISSTAIGSFLVAAASSFPDAVSVFVALKVLNVNLAIGTILGSNLFNILVLCIGDVFYRPGSIWMEAEDKHMLTATIGILLTIIVMLIVKRKSSRFQLSYLAPSILVIFSYIVFAIIIWS
ncbi:sodium:calcium antiporter [Aquibacillus rhizosphaerae]|uniref:Sodium:calcium antiporter n=1 Tax=Aquibacillus rhizosphaerae TaxID=3051431 RepID=A0ABT7L5L9_9BACI|nr:sodium:calcium antiporter [Aquibacillus sp. LR5S19]MDL4841154.1 sodium:calcium antiporter [Aquibacillus sp. LR5S19]